VAVIARHGRGGKSVGRRKVEGDATPARRSAHVAQARMKMASLRLAEGRLRCRKRRCAAVRHGRVWRCRATRGRKRQKRQRRRYCRSRLYATTSAARSPRLALPPKDTLARSLYATSRQRTGAEPGVRVRPDGITRRSSYIQVSTPHTRRHHAWRPEDSIEEEMRRPLCDATARVHA